MPDLTKSNHELSEDSFRQLFNCAEKNPWMKERKRDESLRDLFELCGTQAEADLIVELLSLFDFAQPNDISDFVYDVILKVVEIPQLTAQNCGFVPKPNNEKSFDSSRAIMTMLQTNFPVESGFNRHNLYATAEECLDDPSIEHIVLVDDFSGTGGSLEGYVKWIDDFCGGDEGRDVAVHAFFYRAMEETRKRTYPNRLLNLESHRWMKKGISGQGITNEEVSKKIASMKVLESKLKGLRAEYSLGYRQSESLYACQSLSTPNNLFPIFWIKKVRGRMFHRPLLVRK